MLRRFSDSLGEAFPQPKNKRRRIDIGDDKRKNMVVNDNPQGEQYTNQQQALQVVLSHDFFNVRTKVWCDAIDAGKLDWIRFFGGASVNVCFHAWRDTWTRQPLTTPLTYAIEKQKWDIVEWLVRDGGANPNFCPLPAAKTTARKIETDNSSDYSFAIVSVLGPNTASFPVVPLTHAVKWGHLTTVKTLVQHGARIHNVRACWQYTNEPGAAAETKSGDTTEDTPTGCHLVQKECDRFGYSALHWACTWWFDKREQDPDAYGQRLQLVDFLLNKGAEINENSNVLGRTPLHQLCSTCYAENKISVGGKMALLQLLLDRGADPNLTSRDGRTPLQLAMHKRSYFAVEYLLHRDPSLPWSSAPEAKEETSSATKAASTTTAIAAPKLIREAIKRNPLPVAALVTNYRVDKLAYSRSCKLLDKMEHQVWDEIEEPKYKQFLLFFYAAAVFGDWRMLEAVLVHLKLSSKEQQQSVSFLVGDTTVPSYSASYSFEAERALKLLQYFFNHRSMAHGTTLLNALIMLDKVIATTKSIPLFLIEEFEADPTIVDRLGWGVLHSAAKITECHRACSAIRDLVSKFPTIDLNARDNEGRTAMEYTVLCGKTAVAKCLWKLGADCSPCPRTGDTLLHLACRQSKHSMIDCCLDELGFEVDVVNQVSGETPAMVACSNESTHSIALYLFLQRSASRELTDLKGESALEKIPPTAKESFLQKLASEEASERAAKRRKMWGNVVGVGSTALGIGMGAALVYLGATTNGAVGLSSIAEDIRCTIMDPGFNLMG